MSRKNLYKSRRALFTNIVPASVTFRGNSSSILAIANRGPLLGILELCIHHVVAHTARHKFFSGFVLAPRGERHY